MTQKVIQGVYDGVTTHELDELAAQTAAYMATQHPDFSRLAARISVLTQRLFLKFSELQVRVDGVDATSRHRDAVDAAVREPTRDGICTTQVECHGP